MTEMNRVLTIEDVYEIIHCVNHVARTHFKSPGFFNLQSSDPNSWEVFFRHGSTACDFVVSDELDNLPDELQHNPEQTYPPHLSEKVQCRTMLVLKFEGYIKDRYGKSVSDSVKQELTEYKRFA